MRLLFCNVVCTCSPPCGTLLVDISVQSDFIVPPSLHVQRGITPLLVTVAKGHAEVVHFLLANGSSVQEQDNVGKPNCMLSSCDHLMFFAGASALVYSTSNAM